MMQAQMEQAAQRIHHREIQMGTMAKVTVVSITAK